MTLPWLEPLVLFAPRGRINKTQNSQNSTRPQAGMNFYFCRVSPESRFRTFSLSSFFLAPFGAGLTQSEYPDACDTVCVKCFSLTQLSLVLFLEVCASNDQLQTLANLQSSLGSNGSSTSVNRGWVKTRWSQDRAKLSKRYWLALCAIKHEWLSIYRYQLVRFQPNTLVYRSTSRRTLHTSTKMQQTFRIYRYDIQRHLADQALKTLMLGSWVRQTKEMKHEGKSWNTSKLQDRLYKLYPKHTVILNYNLELPCLAHCFVTLAQEHASDVSMTAAVKPHKANDDFRSVLKLHHGRAHRGVNPNSPSGRNMRKLGRHLII